MLNKLAMNECMRTAGRNADKFGQKALYVYSQVVKINGREVAKMAIEEQDVIKTTIMHAMSIGAELVKGKYLLIGTAIGAAGTYFITKVINEDKKDQKIEVLEKA